MSATVKHHSLARMIGVLLLVLGICFIPTVFVALYYREYKEVLCFLATMVPCLVGGILMMKFYSPKDLSPKARDGNIIVTFAWLLSSLIGAVPLLLSGALTNPFDAFFELCSGFSTTGATIITDVEAHSNSILFWRSFTHWLGGMGIIVFVTALLPSIGIGGQIVASAETPGPTMTKITARFSDTARNLYFMYIAFTVMEIILLKLGGMTFLDAAIHTFGTVGTGGFSNYNDSVGHFTSPYIQWVIIVFMALCGVNFNLYFLILKRKIKDFFADEELRFYLVILGTLIALTSIVLVVQGEYRDVGIEKTVRDAAFHIVSQASTTGYATADFDLWPSFCKVMIAFVMITGACSSSTGGGIKMIRVLTAIKFIKRGFFLKLHPNRVMNITINKRPVQVSVITNIVNFIFLYIAVLFVAMLLISVDGFDLVTNFSAVLSCLSNIGPGFNTVGPTMNFAAFSNFSKLVLSICMIAGRLELYTFFMMFSPNYWNSNRA